MVTHSVLLLYRLGLVSTESGVRRQKTTNKYDDGIFQEYIQIQAYS